MMTIGQIAFEAYSTSMGGVTYDGKPIPQWSDLTLAVQQGWEAAAIAAATASTGRPSVLQLTEREVKEIKHALFYFYECNHGTTGHNQLALIAKMATFLGCMLRQNPETGEQTTWTDVELPAAVEVSK